MHKLKIFTTKYWHYIVIVAIAAIFFISASAYNFYVQRPAFAWPEGEEFIKWASPDESANYVFSKLYGQEGKLYFYEKYNVMAKDIIRPRSLRSDNGIIKPVSFLGMPILYGTLASFFSYEVIPYLTPFFAALSLVYYFLLVRMIFGQKVALASSLILASFPVYLYYGSRSMFHNVPFVSFLVIALYYAMKMSRKTKQPDVRKPAGENRWIDYVIDEIKKISWKEMLFSALCGLALGTAIALRTSEAIWIAPVFLILWLANLRKAGIMRPLLAAGFIILALLPVMYWNQILFSAPLNGGYPEMNKSIYDLSQAGSAIAASGASGNLSGIGESIKKINETVFHFGLNFSRSFMVFDAYFIKMFYWIFWPSAAGLVLLLLTSKKLKKRHWVYLGCFFITSSILVLYYGSWEFYDNPDKSEHTIGNSYTRYWLPIYLGALPLASIFLIKISGLLKTNSFYRISLISAAIAASYILSINFLLYGSSEGLIISAAKNFESRKEYEKVLEITENNSVIVTRYHDKLFFPERKVILGEFNDMNMIREYAGLAKLIPVYYYNFTLPKKSVDYLNQRKLKEAGLNIVKIEQIADSFTLYRLDYNGEMP